MTTTNVYTSAGLAALAKFITLDTLFAFDLDGTLAPIVDDYTTAQVPEPVRVTLKRLASLAKVAVITGRSRKDALEILGFEPQLLVGNHGAEWPRDSNSRNVQFVQWCISWRERLTEMLGAVQGVEVEFKGESISLHYRRAIDQESAVSHIDTAIKKLSPGPRRIGGKYVVNLMPMEALTKGEALLAAMDRFRLERAMFFGDDVTDEEVFQLKRVDLFGVHIGKDVHTAATYYLDSQSDILGLLNCIVGIIEFLSGGGAKT